MMMDEEIQSVDGEVGSYKRLNKQLHRKIQARNKKIKFLYDCIHEYEKINADQQNLLNELAQTLVKDRDLLGQHVNSSINEAKSVPGVRKSSLTKQKREDNIFRREQMNHNSISAIKPRVFEQDKLVRLPMIASKGPNIENPEKSPYLEPATEPKKEKSVALIEMEKKKVYRVPVQRLVPLTMEEIRQRIEKKFR